MSEEIKTVPGTIPALEFLRRFHGDAAWNLVAISPDRKGAVGKTFPPGPERDALVVGWLSEHVQDNCYHSVAEPKPEAPHKKLDRADVVCVRHVFADVDPRAGEELATDRPRILAQLQSFRIPPTIIVDSGRGYQAFWTLAEPVELDGEDGPCTVAFEARCRALEHELDGDINVWDTARILRLPGTTNWPDARKRKKNPGIQPAQASVVEWHPERVYRLEDLPAMEPVRPAARKGGEIVADTVDLPPVKIARFAHVDEITGFSETAPHERVERLRMVIAQGGDPDRPEITDRSHWVYHVGCEAARLGLSRDTIVSIFLEPSFGISAHVLAQGNPERYAERQADRTRDAVQLEERDFARGKDGQGPPLKTQENVWLALSKLGVELEQDTFARRLLVSGPDGEPKRELSDETVTKLRLRIDREFHFLVDKDLFREILLDRASDNKHHPILELIDAQPRADADDHLAEDLFISFFGVEDTPLHRVQTACWAVAAVRRLRRPGTKFDTMLILEGIQGTSRSRALAVLAVRSEWFGDNLPLNAESQRFIEASDGTWIVEASELVGAKGAIDNSERMKANLSRTKDKARMAYGHFPEMRERQFTIIGTTNRRDYLKDPTGNRRFWPMRCGTVRWKELDRELVLRFWAAASAREARGDPVELDPKLYPDAREAQEQRRDSNEFEDLYEEQGLGELAGFIRSDCAWAAARVTETRDRLNPILASHRKDAMVALGWEPGQRRIGESRPRGFSRGEGPVLRWDTATGKWVTDETTSAF